MKRALFLVAMLPSCHGYDPPTTTGGIATDELSLQVIAESDGSSASVRIGIYALGHDTYSRLLLEEDEHLVLRADGASDVEMHADSPSVPSYLGSIETSARTLRIDLVRPRAASVLGTEITLPESFAIVLPKVSITRSKSFTLNWSPPSPADPMKVTLGGPCLTTAPRTLASDNGEFTWSLADYRVPKGQETASCPVTIDLVREGGAIRNGEGLAPIQLFRSSQKRRITLIASP